MIVSIFFITKTLLFHSFKIWRTTWTQTTVIHYYTCHYCNKFLSQIKSYIITFHFKYGPLQVIAIYIYIHVLLKYYSNPLKPSQTFLKQHGNGVVYMSCVTKTASFPCELTWLASLRLEGSQVRCPGRCTPVEYLLPNWYWPFGSLSPSCQQGIGLSQSEASPPFSAER